MLLAPSDAQIALDRNCRFIGRLFQYAACLKNRADNKWRDYISVSSQRA
ncbi:MAG: hypothetical protein QG552_1522 [Thermodesulfobacteriota bacterium]|nr:hypothetical protein [Thermodesulfobacteriota bacterium]